MGSRGVRQRETPCKADTLCTVPPSLPSPCWSRFTRASGELGPPASPGHGELEPRDAALHMHALVESYKGIGGWHTLSWIIHAGFLCHKTFSCKEHSFWKTVLIENSADVVLYLLICLSHLLGRQELTNIRIIKCKVNNGPLWAMSQELCPDFFLRPSLQSVTSPDVYKRPPGAWALSGLSSKIDSELQWQQCAYYLVLMYYSYLEWESMIWWLFLPERGLRDKIKRSKDVCMSLLKHIWNPAFLAL